ncbi:MAG: hypothetical protein ACRDNE_08980 [Gaiellaceae bacterium]
MGRSPRGWWRGLGGGGEARPERAPHRTPAELEAVVLAVRERLVANPWAQVGAEAIA